MKKWVWHIGLAAMGALIAACTSGETNGAGTSLETENSFALMLAVQKGDGSPAARTKIFVRPSEFLAPSTLFWTKRLNSLSISPKSSKQA